MWWWWIGWKVKWTMKQKKQAKKEDQRGHMPFVKGKVLEKFPEMKIPKRVQNRGITCSILSYSLCCRLKNLSPLYCFRATSAGHLQPCVGSALGCGEFYEVMKYEERTVHDEGQTRMAPGEFSRSLVTINNPQRYWER